MAKAETGAFTINEIRDDENDPTVDWGDKPFSLKAASATPPR